VVEFGVRIRIWHDDAPEIHEPVRTYSVERDGERRVVDAVSMHGPRTRLGRALARMARRL
jgi:hypothetical protein